jgi:hypothetical protein
VRHFSSRYQRFLITTSTVLSARVDQRARHRATGQDLAEAGLWPAGLVTGIIVPVGAGASSQSSALHVLIVDAGGTR